LLSSEEFLAPGVSAGVKVDEDVDDKVEVLEIFEKSKDFRRFS